MRLTNQLRDAFVNAVMTDVPNPCDKLRKDAQALLQQIELKDLPEADAAVLRKYAPYMHKGSQYIRNRYFDKLLGLRELTDEELKPVSEIVEESIAAGKARDDLRIKLMSVANSCTTVKALHEALPEFAKYITDDAPLPKNLPALANVVADFVKAGWPAAKTKTTG